MIHIKMLGGFHVDVDGRSADGMLGKSPKGILLLQYLMLHPGESVPARRLMEIMWPNESSASPEGALKTLISRLRTILTQIHPTLTGCLITARGGYRWESRPGVSVDLEEFDRLAAQLENTEELTGEARHLYRSVLQLFVGELLQDQECPAWAKPKADKVRLTYLTLVEDYLRLLEQEGDAQEMISVCRTALDAQPFNDGLHLRLTEALMTARRDQEALRQYQHASNLTSGLNRESYDANVREYYAQLMRSEQTINDTLDELYNGLVSDVDTAGALVCDSHIFREMYHLQKRCLERLGADILLGVVMVSGMEDQPLQLDRTMTGLIDVMRSNLRRGDTVTRQNVNQIAMLLPMASEAQGQMIMERIKRGFYQRFPNSDCRLSCRFALLNADRRVGASARKTE
ncbi:MAG: hypothetical protein E7316_03610 [Clostridiales bacterium]|nr:hypothetical protein [Clostridiales bacterium]